MVDASTAADAGVADSETSTVTDSERRLQDEINRLRAREEEWMKERRALQKENWWLRKETLDLRALLKEFEEQREDCIEFFQTLT